MQAWRDFWNGEHSIYVNERHRQLHDRLVAHDIAALVPGPQAVVLDFGCGEATEAGTVAAACRELLLCDAAPSVREHLRSRFADARSIRVIAPEDIAILPVGSLDLVVVNSVVQYLSRDELVRSLAMVRPLLRPEGRLVIGDVISPDSGTIADVQALLSFGLEGGFAGAALRGLARTFFSDYRRLRASVGLSRYREDEMLALLRQAGFTASRLDHNIGHNQARMTFQARPRAASA